MNEERRNFILGAGEQLVRQVLPPARAPRSSAPYQPDEARARLAPRAASTVRALRLAPAEALPDGEAVAALTLHPQFLSKSAYPSDLLREAGLRAIGSKPDTVKPEKVARKSSPEEEPTATLFVAGQVDAFQRLAARLEGPLLSIPSAMREELTAVEDLRAVTPEDRIAGRGQSLGEGVLECVLHAGAGDRDARVVRAFEKYALSLGVRVDLENEIFASGLCFLAVSGEEESIQKLAWFSFLRRIRPMPRMRPLLPTRISRSTAGKPIVLPGVDAIDPTLAAAVFDVALPPDHALGRWVTAHDHGVPPFTDPDDLLHGLCVSSAAAFGPLEGLNAGMPPVSLHHHGVLGDDPDGKGYLAALQTIQHEVKKNDYKLFNLSFGPQGAIEDDVVDSFTAVIDELVGDGSRLAFIAVGNDGDLDDSLGLNRVQPPSDAVNAVGVGSSDSRRSDWKRSEYSCVGPGRLGSLVKPDVVAFGGSVDEPFGCVGPGPVPERYDTQGTSFASPSAMRTASAVMATMGSQLSVVALKALLVHGCRRGVHDVREVGHGLVQADLESLLTSADNEVKVIFQGLLSPGKYVRHDIPLPPDLEGKVEMEATLCYASRVDPNFPATYVQAGVETIFRPHSGRFGVMTLEDGTKRTSTTVKSETLFNQGRVYGGSADRRDAHLWETVLKASRNKMAATLQNPSVELHYNRREAGQPVTGQNQPDIPYALVFTLRCKAVSDLYDRVRTRFGANLRVMAPRIDIPVRV